jgi:hypothetical protein
MKIFFFAVTEYPGVRGTLLEQDLVKCGVRFFIEGRGVDVVVILVEDERQERCVLKTLYESNINYVFEMEGAPRVLKFIMTRVGNTLARIPFS